MPYPAGGSKCDMGKANWYNRVTTGHWLLLTVKRLVVMLV